MTKYKKLSSIQIHVHWNDRKKCAKYEYTGIKKTTSTFPMACRLNFKCAGLQRDRPGHVGMCIGDGIVYYTAVGVLQGNNVINNVRITQI